MSNSKKKTGRKWSAAARRRVARRRAKWRNSPAGRLEADGSSRPENIKQRLLCLLHEWQLPMFPPIGRSPGDELFDYCKTHDISLDWMLWGDLKGLQRMKQWRRMGKAAASPASLKDKIARLSESEREVVRKMVDRLIEGAS